MAVEFEVEQVIAAPREEVFDAHIDIDRYHEWMPGCEGIEKLDDGLTEVGTSWRETRKMGKHTGTGVLEISALDRPESLSIYCDGSKGSTGRGEYFFDYDFEEVDAGTRVTMKGKVDMGGFFANLFARLLKGMFVKQLQKDMDALAAHLEN